MDAQVLGISVDSVPTLKAFAESLGGIHYPLLADFHPKGEVARKYGVYFDDKGFTARATIVVGKDGIVKWVKVNELDQQRSDDEIVDAIRQTCAS